MPERLEDVTTAVGVVVVIPRQLLLMLHCFLRRRDSVMNRRSLFLFSSVLFFSFSLHIPSMRAFDCLPPPSPDLVESPAPFILPHYWFIRPFCGRQPLPNVLANGIASAKTNVPMVFFNKIECLDADKILDVPERHPKVHR